MWDVQYEDSQNPGFHHRGLAGIGLPPAGICVSMQEASQGGSNIFQHFAHTPPMSSGEMSKRSLQGSDRSAILGIVLLCQPVDTLFFPHCSPTTRHGHNRCKPAGPNSDRGDQRNIARAHVVPGPRCTSPSVGALSILLDILVSPILRLCCCATLAPSTSCFITAASIIIRRLSLLEYNNELKERRRSDQFV
jgi:hypothetical protein